MPCRGRYTPRRCTRPRLPDKHAGCTNVRFHRRIQPRNLHSFEESEYHLNTEILILYSHSSFLYLIISMIPIEKFIAAIDLNIQTLNAKSINCKIN